MNQRHLNSTNLVRYLIQLSSNHLNNNLKTELNLAIFGGGKEIIEKRKYLKELF